MISISQGQSFLTNGLVAYYPFNGNANDASGNENDAVPSNVVITNDRFGTPNSAYFWPLPILQGDTQIGFTVNGG